MNLQRLIPFYDPTVKDWSLTARLMRWLTFLWLAIGSIVLFSASFYHGEVEKNDGFYYFNRQIFAILISLFIFNAIVHIPLRKLLNIASWGLLGILLLLLLTAFTGLGHNTMGATRWIALGPVQIQPSESIKPFLVLQGAILFGRWRQHSPKFKIAWLGAFALVLLAILKQPNLSTTSLCAMGLWSIAFAAGLPLRSLLLTAVGGFIIAGGA